MNSQHPCQGCRVRAARAAVLGAAVAILTGLQPDMPPTSFGPPSEVKSGIPVVFDPWSGPREVLKTLRKGATGAGLAEPARQEELVPMSGISVGTAWPITEGYAVTNNHIITDTKVITLFDAGDEKVEEFVAFVVARDVENDLAILKVKNPKDLPPALPVSSEAARMGTPVFTIGYPRIDLMGTTPKLSAGLISAITGLRDDPGTYQISAPIEPGNSGGPLLTMRGEVVGIVATMLYAKDASDGSEYRVPNVSYALKTAALRSLIESLPEHKPVLREINRDSATLEELAERVERSVMIVMAW